jgi:hypothetical protein
MTTRAVTVQETGPSAPAQWHWDSLKFCEKTGEDLGERSWDGENNKTQSAFTPISPARVLLTRVLNSLCFSVQLCVLCG